MPTDLSDEGVRKRLNSLVDRGVLLSDDAGKQTKIYWLNHPASQWPVSGDISESLSESDRSTDETVAKINRLTRFALLYGGFFAGLYVLDWLSGSPMTDGIFEVTLNWTVMPALAFGLLAVVFYIALQTSLHAEGSDRKWTAIQRVYQRLAN